MNPMKYYVDAEGNYLGGWDANPPAGAIEVPVPPEDARQKWNGGDWLPHILPPAPLSLTDEASALLTVIDGEVYEAERAKGIAGAFSFGGTAYVYYDVMFDDDSYIAICNAPVVKFPDHAEISLAGFEVVKLIVQQIG